MKYARECLRDYPVVTSSEKKTVKLTMTVDTFNCLTIVPCLFLLLLTLQYKVCFCFVFYARLNPSKHCRLGRDVAKLAFHLSLHCLLDRIYTLTEFLCNSNAQGRHGKSGFLMHR